jgi:hypothetical protein
MSVQENIEQFIEEAGISGQPHEVANTSDLFPRNNNRCYEVRLSREGSADYEYLYAYVGLGIHDMSLADMLRHLIDEAEHYGGWATFDEWNRQNDEGYYERELGRETAEKWYSYCRETYYALIKVLGQDLYEKLANIVNN